MNNQLAINGNLHIQTPNFYRFTYLVSENFMLKPKSCVVVG